MEGGANSPVALVFDNHLIVGNILSHLDFTSIKSLSCVNQTLNQLIRQNSNVLNRSKFRFCFEDPQNEHQSPKPSTFSPHHFGWTNVCVELHSGWEKDQFQAILPLISTIKKLEVHAGWMRGIDSEVILKERMEMFFGLLNATTELRELTICANVLDMLGLEEFNRVLRKYDNVQANLEKLESLVIKSSNADGHHSVISPHGFGSILGLLGVMPKALTKFEICKITAMGYDSSAEWDLEGLPEGILPIIEKYSTSLTSIVLEQFMWERDSPNTRVDSIVFPSLKHITISAEGKHLSRVTNFLNRQPPLQSLTLMLGSPKYPFQDGTGEVDCRKLMAPLLRYGPTLRQLTLSWRESSSRFEVSRTFSCLKNFGILRQLSLRQKTDEEDVWVWRDIRTSLDSALAFLPDGICELNLAGIPVGTWNYPYEQNQLARFQGLTKLNLVNCPNIVDNEVMGQICSQMTQLMEFGFSHCDAVTDAGITCLGDLKGLRKLEILCCEKLTQEALVQVIIFQELRELTIVYRKKALELEFYAVLLKQNKNLKILKISTTESNREAELQKALKQESQAFRSLLFIKPLRRPEFYEDDDDEDDDEDDEEDDEDDDEEDYEEDDGEDEEDDDEEDDDEEDDDEEDNDEEDNDEDDDDDL